MASFQSYLCLSKFFFFFLYLCVEEWMKREPTFMTSLIFFLKEAADCLNRACEILKAKYLQIHLYFIF